MPAVLGELLEGELVGKDELVKFDVVEELEVAELLPQDTNTKDGTMRMQIANKYNLLFILPF
jgi:uncharacterized protein involved in propanediol utilization